MEEITEKQFLNLIMSCDVEWHKFPRHIRNDVESLRKCTKNGKAYLLLTWPKGQDKHFLEYVEIDKLCPEEIKETCIYAKENRGGLVAV